MVLPSELTKLFEQQLAEHEASMGKPYITSIERHGIEKGLQQGIQAHRVTILHLVERRFDANTAEAVALLLEKVDDAGRLTEMSDWIFDSTSAEELLRRLRERLD